MIKLTTFWWVKREGIHSANGKSSRWYQLMQVPNACAACFYSFDFDNSFAMSYLQAENGSSNKLAERFRFYRLGGAIRLLQLSSGKWWQIFIFLNAVHVWTTDNYCLTWGVRGHGGLRREEGGVIIKHAWIGDTVKWMITNTCSNAFKTEVHCILYGHDSFNRFRNGLARNLPDSYLYNKRS